MSVFILDGLYISFRTNVFSPIRFYAARVALRATCLHFVGAPFPLHSPPAFCHCASSHTKYGLLSNEKCEIQPTLINLNPNEYIHLQLN